MTKTDALAKYLECQPNEITEDGDRFDVHGNSYLVLTDEEADQLAREYIVRDLWAFNIDFLSGYTDALGNEQAIRAMRLMQEKLCEDAQPMVLALVKDNLDGLVKDAIDCDGRGHFLSTYDWTETRLGQFYIYRID